MNRKEIIKISEALELVARISIGQIDRIDDFYYFGNGLGNPSRNRDYTDYWFSKLKEEVFPEMANNMNYGIGSEKVLEDSRIAWEICSEINYFIAWDENPKGGYGVNFREPLKVTEEQNVKVKKEGEEYQFKKITEKQKKIVNESKKMANEMLEGEFGSLLELLKKINKNINEENTKTIINEVWKVYKG